MDFKEFWINIFTNLGFKKTEIIGRIAFKIPIYEAIYMSQIMGPPKPTNFDSRSRIPFKVAILTRIGKVLQFPSSCPAVFIKDISWDKTSMDWQLNPLLSPSLNFIKKRWCPEFFVSTDKYLLFGNDSKILEEIKEEGLNPADFVLFMEGYQKRKGPFKKYIDENMMEYVTSSFLRSRGFIVDKFNERLTIGPGSPDLFAIKIPELQNELVDLGITSGGFYLNELELSSLLGKRTTKQRIKEAKSIVIEVESLTSSGRFSAGRKQVIKYLSYGCYNEGYVAIPFQEQRARTVGGEPKDLGFDPFNDVGIITLTEKGEIILRDCLMSYGERNKVKELLKNVERIIKLTLLKNLSLREVFDLLPGVDTFYDLYFAVDRLQVSEIVAVIKQ